MTTDNRADSPGPGPGSNSSPDPASQPAAPTPQPFLRRDLLPLPALAAISLYMVVLAIVDVVGVVGGQFRPIYLVLAALFLAAAGGLLLLFRWAWALTLAAVVLLAGLFFFKFYTDQQLPFIIQGLMNLVFFLYLVRPEVREKLR
jgi:hypothetical protein